MTTEQPSEDAAPSIPVPGAATADDRTWGMFAHLSALLGIVLGGLMFLGPLIVWLVKKDQSAFVAYHGREALNFQIMWLIVFAALVVLGFVTCGIGFFLLPIAGVVNIVMTIIAGVAANKGERYAYPFSLRLVS